MKLVFFSVMLCAACALEPKPSSTEASRYSSDLTLRDIEGSDFSLSNYRGASLLVLVFTTFDSFSQLGLDHLEVFHRQHPEFPILAVAMQPNPERIVPLYIAGLNLSFRVAYDPYQQLGQGSSPLGVVQAVPGYFLLDEDGTVSKRYFGLLDSTALEEWAFP